MQKSVSTQERKKDFHAGPHNSFPIGPAGEHLKAAWDLAGHAQDPEAVRSKILQFAHEHGLEDHLPEAAKNYKVMKAKQGDIADLFHMAWNHESMEGDTHEKGRLVSFADQHNLQHLLPEDAHGMMHEMYVKHNHEGVKNDEQGYHTHTVVKSFDPLAPLTGEVVKSWEASGVSHFEGWLSTPRKDQEKDVTEPEAFLTPAQGYFARMAPLSLQHGLNTLPIGHLQKAAIVRDGVILKEFHHPTDPGEFEHFPSQGSGVWVLGAVNEETGRSALKKGNIGGMSFIANAAKKEQLPGGRYRYTELDPWIESTIAAYPINPDAVIAVVKAFGVMQEEPMKLEEIMQAALEAQKLQKAEADAQTITKAGLGEVLNEFKTSLLTEVNSAIHKALPTDPTDSREGVGRKGTIQKAGESPFEADPAAYLIQKAGSGEEFTLEEKQVVAGLTIEALISGLNP